MRGLSEHSPSLPATAHNYLLLGGLLLLLLLKTELLLEFRRLPSLNEHGSTGGSITVLSPPPQLLLLLLPLVELLEELTRVPPGSLPAISVLRLHSRNDTPCHD